jgi:hypothetical protein
LSQKLLSPQLRNHICPRQTTECLMHNKDRYQTITFSHFDLSALCIGKSFSLLLLQ